jgi:hypothetical protein
MVAARCLFVLMRGEKAVASEDETVGALLIAEGIESLRRLAGGE